MSLHFQRSSLLFLIFISCLILLAQSLSGSSFTRNNDGETSLPLSNKYRDSLKQLCNILKSGGHLPSDLNKAELKLMCKKLQSDTDNIVMSYSDSKKRLLVLLLGGAVLGAYYCQEGVKSFIFRVKSKYFASARLGDMSSSGNNRSSSNNNRSAGRNQNTFLNEERVKYYSSLNSGNSNDNQNKAD